MSDDVTEAVLEEDTYEHARMTVRQFVPLSLRSKLRVAVVALLVATLYGPALAGQRRPVQTFEPTLANPFRPAIGAMVLAGVVLAFVTSVALLGLLLRRHRRDLSLEQARRLVRIEDFVAWFLIQGVLFVTLPTAVAVGGVVSAAPIEQLYDLGVAVYRPDSIVAPDGRLVSALAGTLAVVVVALRSSLARLDGGGHAKSD